MPTTRVGSDWKYRSSPTGWWRLRLDPPWQFVYVLQEGEDGPIKVGVAVDVAERMASLQCGNPRKLRLLMVFPAGYDLEARIHRHLAPVRMEGEWFAASAEAIAELAELDQKMRYAYDGSHRAPSWKGLVSWHNRTASRKRRKPAEVTTRFVDPAALR